MGIFRLVLPRSLARRSSIIYDYRRPSRPNIVVSDDLSPRLYLAGTDCFRRSFTTELSLGCTWCLCLNRDTHCVSVRVILRQILCHGSRRPRTEETAYIVPQLSVRYILSPIVRLANEDIQKSLNFMRTCIFLNIFSLYFLDSSPHNHDSSPVKRYPNHVNM